MQQDFATTTSTSNLNASGAESEKPGIELPIGKSLMPVNAQGTKLIKNSTAQKSTLVVYEDSHGEVLEPLSSRMSEEISQSVNLLNSSVSVLHLQLKKVSQDYQGQDRSFDHQTAMVAGITAKGIADLLKTKCQFMRMQYDMDSDNLDRKRQKRLDGRKK